MGRGDSVKFSGDVNQDWRLGVVVARFNRQITEKLESSALARLEELNVGSGQVELVKVPGAVEIPLAAKWLLDNKCDAVITLGCVIRGETSHYDVVCQSAERGCSQLSLEYNAPVVFGVLTTENEQQAYARAGGEKEDKGAECVDVALEMLNLKRLINQMSN